MLTTFSQNTETYYANAVSRWSAQSSKVSFTKAAQNSTAHLYLMDSKNGPASSYGLAIPYYRDSTGALKIDTCICSKWNHVNVDMYLNNTSAENWTATNLQWLALHEVGHALSMAHNNWGFTSTIMRDNAWVPNTLTQPTESDISHFQLKWGK